MAEGAPVFVDAGLGLKLDVEASVNAGADDSWPEGAGAFSEVTGAGAEDSGGTGADEAGEEDSGPGGAGAEEAGGAGAGAEDSEPGGVGTDAEADPDGKAADDS